MSTYNIGFYEGLTKIIFQVLSNIIKYTPYLFFWVIRTDKKKILFTFYASKHKCAHYRQGRASDCLHHCLHMQESIGFPMKRLILCV